METPPARPIDRRDRTTYLREYRAQVALISEEWGTVRGYRGVKATEGTSAVVETPEGDAIAKFRHYGDAYFMAAAPSIIETLALTVEEVQEELRQARAERRSYAVLTNHLLAAQRAGVTTREGQQRIRDAIDEARTPSANKEWDW